MHYSYTPPRAGKAAYIVTPSVAVLSLLTAAITAGRPSGVFVRPCVFAVILADILVMTKVLLTSYTYTLTDDEGTADLVITRRTGRKNVTVCRVAADAGRFSDNPSEPIPKGTAIYNYLPGLRRKGCVFFPSESEGGGAVLFSPDDTIIHYLKKR